MSTPAGRPVTLADVARRAGTSTAVVSYVMNDGPRPVAPATRERVLAAAAELGYRPNRIARALRSRVTGVVGLVLADALNPYFGALARHVERALAGHGRLMLIGNADYSAERQRHLVERFLAAQVDGLVITAADADDDVAAMARTAGVPAAYLHNGPAAGQTPVVAADNEHAVEEAVAHLRAHGHRDVAFLAGPRDTGPVGRRRQVWRAATGDGGTLLRSGYSRAEADALIRRLAATGDVPRALVAATDEQAIGVLSGACAAGLPVPGRVAVVSLDGSPDSAHTAPALTVTGQPLETMARQAVDLLFTPSASPAAPRAPLIRRRSCGCEEPR
ncbi:LacI family transcriptional regulator [Actinomadura sp. ATCC 31491]|uniref:LacI family transcriptional regulator n=1 Tax=Actinomadura luzonensis TaxID=2805427 RepID=A0ABT0FXP7_9ACTN|nr:LacI family DNA-binding transcriptional regulator [Actinomadura luzonensis]MCK2217034.1 LacI family transcriptional regulator [Actinomadura luzonensis]